MFGHWRVSAKWGGSLLCRAAAVAAVVGGLLPAGGWGAPLGMITHQGIVMALHGIIDHINLDAIAEAREMSSTVLLGHLSTAHAGKWRVGNPDLLDDMADPNANANEGGTGPSGALDGRGTDSAQHQNDGKDWVGDGVGPDALFRMMDVNADDRLFMSELGGVLNAVVRWHLNQLARTTEAQYSKAGGSDDPDGGLDEAAAVAAISHFPKAARYEGQHMEDFADADADADAKLNATEFLGFAHPMFSKVVMLRYAAAFLDDHDADADGMLNVTEFLNANLKIKEEGDDKYAVQAFEHRAEEEELTREFKSDFDTDGDERLKADEIARLLSPLFPTHFLVEAFDLGLAADCNGDHELSLDEVRQGFPLFVANQMLNFGWWLEKQTGKDLDDMMARMTDRLVRHGLRHHEEL